MPLLRNLSTLKVRRLWTLSISSLFSVAALVVTLLFLHPTSAESASSKAEEAAFFASDPPFIRSHLYEIQPLLVELEEFADKGGAIEPLGDKLLLVTPRGRIALIHADGEVSYLPQRVPMFESAPNEPITWIGFRVADILLNEKSPEDFTLFVSHHYLVGDCVEFRISSTELDLDHEATMFAGDWKTEFTAKPCIDTAIFGYWEGDVPKIGGGIQAGGRMLMDGAEHLLVAVGDHAWYEWHEREKAGDPENPPLVDPDSHLGKLMRIELASGKVEIFAGGFRNPQGLARDREGNLWLTEHGPESGDELNLVRPDLDYGWPYVTYGILYGNRIWPYNKAQGRHDGFEEPAFAWIPAIGISNLISSDGQQFPLWQDDLLIGSLRGNSLFRVRVRQRRVTNFERIDIGHRLRDVVQMPDGRIALLSDRAKVIFLQRAPIYCQDKNDVESIYMYDADDVCRDVSGVLGEADDLIIRSLQNADFDDPFIRSLFNVYIYEDQLIYVKSPCSENDLSHKFLLHVTPVHTENLLEEHKELGINVYDSFSFREEFAAARNEDGCIVIRNLPEYDISRIYTGQVLRVEDSGGEVSWVGPIWDGSYVFSKPSPAARSESEASSPSLAEEANLSGTDVSRIAQIADDPIIRSLRDIQFGHPALPSLFNVYVHDNRLIYAKSPCSEYDISHRFFLHITPVDAKDLAEEHEHLGFSVNDFDSYKGKLGVDVTEYGCVVAHALPEYDIKHIYTGQVVRVEKPTGEVSWIGPIWEGSFEFSDLPAAATRENSPYPSANDQNTASGAALYAAYCAGCHNLAAEHSVGPHLYGVIGRRAGDVAGFNATAALTALDIVWTRENLAEFIVNPTQFAPGTSMSDVGITDEEAQHIAEFLAANN